MNDPAVCKQLLSSLSEFIDGSLSDELCHVLQHHLDGCQNCQVVLDTMKKTIYLYQVTAETGGPPGDVRQRLFTSLNLEDYICKEEKDDPKAAQ